MSNQHSNVGGEEEEEKEGRDEKMRTLTKINFVME